MASIFLAPGIESASGAFTKINKHSQHVNDQTMFLATHRVAGTCSLKCQRAYFRKIYQLAWNSGQSFATPEVLQRRLDFATAATEVAARKKDLSKVTPDTTQFLAIRSEVLAKGGRITMKSFLWAAKRLMGEAFSTGAITMTADQYLANSYAG